MIIIIVSLKKPGTPAELVHAGVKGMKWGIRKAYTESVDSRAARQRRVGEGRGSAKDKLRIHTTTSNLSLIRSAKSGRPGFKGAALVRAERSEAHSARIKAGEATVHDMLRVIGTLRTDDIGIGIYYGRGKTAKKSR